MPGGWAFPISVGYVSMPIIILGAATYLEDRLEPLACHKTVIDAFLHRAPHPDSSEVVEVELVDISADMGDIH